MANSQQGKAPIDIDGTTYTLSLSIDAMCEIEDEASKRSADPANGVTFQDVVERVNRGDIRSIRLLFWGALRDHHRELTVKQAGELLSKVGGIAAVTKQMGVVMGETEPDPADIAGSTARPPRRQPRKAGTGASSSATDGPQG